LTDFGHPIPRPAELKEVIQTNNRGSCIAASAPETCAHGNPFTELDVEANRVLRPFKNGGRCFIDEVALINSQSLCIACEPDPTGRSRQLNQQLVLKTDRVHNGPEIMIAIGATIEDAKNQVDFCGGMDGNGG
jgi:hypothetical protein